MLESSSRRAGPTLHRIAAPDTLREAWRRVRANKGGPGRDGVTLETFAQTLDGRIAALSAALLRETYKPGKLLRIAIAKPNGGRRQLAIPNVVDRLAQTAALVVLGPELDRRMSTASFAYRPKRSVADAIAAVEAAFAAGLVWTLDADLDKFFDRIAHRRLLDELAIWIEEDGVLRLFMSWLRTFSMWGRGIAQGSPVSPLLANLFLHPLDRLAAAHGVVMVRYADDFVALAARKGTLEETQKMIVDVLQRRGLKLNAPKTRVVPPGQPFVFLGRSLTAPASTGQRR
ncbi:MAG: reverse transcriptase domain-containing protein [Hyphomicrobiaceae bacterium]